MTFDGASLRETKSSTVIKSSCDDVLLIWSLGITENFRHFSPPSKHNEQCRLVVILLIISPFAIRSHPLPRHSLWRPWTLRISDVWKTRREEWKNEKIQYFSPHLLSCFGDVWIACDEIKGREKKVSHRPRHDRVEDNFFRN